MDRVKVAPVLRVSAPVRCLFALLFLFLFFSCAPAQDLGGQPFRITVLQEGSFLHVEEDRNQYNNSLSFSGYLIDMVEALAKRANFTYQLLTPSGFGSNCRPQLNTNTTEKAYGAQYRTQYHCGEEDVNELRGSKYGTDIYLGMYYLSPERQSKNWFTVPFEPPFKGTPAMYGITTGVATISELVEQQALGNHPPACMAGSSATLDFVNQSHPGLQIQPFFGGEKEVYESMASGECPIHIFDAPIAAQFTLRRFRGGECLAGGQPIGLIGEPMTSGLSHYAIGVGRHLNRSVVDTLSHWLNVLMVDGTLSSFYEGQGGTGKECGYVLYPAEEDDRLLSNGGIVGIVIGAVVAVAIPFALWHMFAIRRQQKRYRKRFVQQIARNIEIGRRPGCISPEKLSAEIQHIGQGKDCISKADLSKWIHDIKMNFISERDFQALWNAMDVDGTGEVDAVEFVVFLSACGPEFEEVYEEIEKLPKLERLKLAARRLTNLASHGEEGVRQIERSLELRSRRRGPVSSSITSRASDRDDSL